MGMKTKRYYQKLFPLKNTLTAICYLTGAVGEDCQTNISEYNTSVRFNDLLAISNLSKIRCPEEEELVEQCLPEEVLTEYQTPGPHAADTLRNNCAVSTACLLEVLGQVQVIQVLILTQIQLYVYVHVLVHQLGKTYLQKC
ncbi:hypothetical protein ABEB36_009369, partial [Hypothenemus hampei]